MCGIAAAVGISDQPVPRLGAALALMNRLQAHRGPDGEGAWVHPRSNVGFAHRRLSIIDLGTGQQPMSDESGRWITFNGEIYNYIELREELGREQFRTTSDTEVILRGWTRWGKNLVHKLRGMFAFAIWDERERRFFCARDPAGIKPLYYCTVDGALYLASEAKALLPFLPRVEVDPAGLKDYLTFQFCLDGRTLFKGVRELPPGHFIEVGGGTMKITKYWDVDFQPEEGRGAESFREELHAAMVESVKFHLRADVPVGSYLSGGLDSSIVASLAAGSVGKSFEAFIGKFALGADYDESRYARDLAAMREFPLHELEITAQDFIQNIRKIIYHLDQPVAGPGSFPQYMISGLARTRFKVVLGGQGGDEIFGGYARYLLGYLDLAMRAAIEGKGPTARLPLTLHDISPSLRTLEQYKPLMQELCRDGMFGPVEQRYLRLVNRAPALENLVNWRELGDHDPRASFMAIFDHPGLARATDFDRMTYFDYKTLLPALLQVEDRVSMAHGLESRVPFVDREIISLAARIPASVKFAQGNLKQLMRDTFRNDLPTSIVDRTDKMGFPVPLNEWMKGVLFEFIADLVSSERARSRPYLAPGFDPRSLVAGEKKFSRNMWGLLSLELWFQEYADKSAEWRAHYLNLDGARAGLGS